MLSLISQSTVVVLGTSLAVLSGWGVVKPDKLIRMVTSVLDRPSGIYFGVGVRLVLGVTLIVSAPDSVFPLVFRLLGWLALFAALALVVMGRVRISQLINWFRQLSGPMIRLWLLFGMAFGGFLVYGTVQPALQ